MKMRFFFIISMMLFMSYNPVAAADNAAEIQGALYAKNSWSIYSMNVEVTTNGSIVKATIAPGSIQKVLSPQEVQDASLVRMQAQPKVLGGLAVMFGDGYKPNYGFLSDEIKQTDFAQYNVIAHIDETLPKEYSVQFAIEPIRR